MINFEGIDCSMQKSPCFPNPCKDNEICVSTFGKEVVHLGSSRGSSRQKYSCESKLR